jgi:putative DNA primase/helicase
MSNFLEIATPYAQMGIPVFPLLPNEKRPPASMTDWPDIATTDSAQIAKWNAEEPNYNFGLVAKPDGIVILEFDIAKGMPLAAQKMGQEVPKTRVHISGKGFGHWVFLQTDRTRTIGNRSVNLPDICEDPKCEKAGQVHHHEWFSFRQNNRYVVGPGSIHPNGNEYGVARDVAPLPCPEWVCDFVEKHSVGRNATRDARPVAEDFDFDDLCEHYGWDVVNIDGEWHTTAVCPIAGYQHEHSVGTGFYWDGESIGFKCFAQGCEGSSMSIGQVLKYLNQQEGGPGPYPKKIWEEEDLDLTQFGGELDEVKPKPTIANVLAALAKMGAKEIKSETKPEETCLSADTRAELTAMLAEATLEKDDTTPIAPAVVAPEEIEPDEEEFAKGMANKGEPNERTITLLTQRADTVKMEKQEWLWEDRIPKGLITLFSGKPDCGKSVAMTNVIACVTTGRDWPDGKKNTDGPQDVVLAATEDRADTTLVPRLAAAGADLTRVHLVKRVTVKGKKSIKRMLQLKEDLLLIKRLLLDHPEVALIALDPITGYFGDVDPNKDKDVRPLMQGINDAVEKSKTAVLGIIHHNKRQDAGAMEKVAGAGAIVQISRAVWGFSRDTENKEECYMVLVKGNLAKKRSGMKYKIAGVDVKLPDGRKTNVPVTEWIGETDKDASEVMEQERESAKNGPADSKLMAARLLIKTELESGPKLVRELYRKGEAEGISAGTMKAARYSKEMEIIAVQQNDGWYWQFGKAGQAAAIAAVAKNESTRIPDTDVM